MHNFLFLPTDMHDDSKKNIITLVSIKTLPSKTKLFSWRYLVAKNNIDLIRLVLPFFILPAFSPIVKVTKVNI